jgi:hypothetical protein
MAAWLPEMPFMLSSTCISVKTLGKLFMKAMSLLGYDDSIYFLITAY